MNRIVLLSILTLSAAVAEDITLTDGTVLRKAKILKQEAATLKIEHKDGISNVGPGLLPHEVSRRYTWNSKALESAKQEADAAKAAGDVREATRQVEVAEEKALKARIAAHLADRTAKRKAEGVQVGALKVWLQLSVPVIIQRSGSRAGHAYGICIENTGDNVFRGIARGAVYLGNVGDVAQESKLVIEPGKTATFIVESQIGCGDETQIVMEIEAANRKGANLILRAPKNFNTGSTR